MQGSNPQRNSFFIIILIISSLTILIAAQSKTTKVNALEVLIEGDAGEATLANCRYGATPLGIGDKGDQVKILPRIGAGWYLDFTARPPLPAPTNDAEFVPMIHVNQDKTPSGEYMPSYTFKPQLKEGLANFLRDNPGKTYIVGSEVDRGPNPGQIVSGKGDTYPEIYAIAYHEAYNFIKQHDPSAQVAHSATVQITPGRLQYLDIVWDTYKQVYGVPMPVDAWTMHLYILPEVEPDGETPNGIANVALGTDPTLGKRSSGGDPALCSDPDVYCFSEHDDMAIFNEQVVAMRRWMNDHGQRNKPLLITEYSILYPYEDDGDTCFLQDESDECFTPTRVSNYMKDSFDYLNTKTDPNLGYPLDNNRLVQQWMWFSIHYNREGASSNIVEKDLVTLTKVGKTFRDYVAAEPTYKNLRVDHLTNDIVTIPGASSTANAKISVTFRNNGNTAVNQPFEVTFYSDIARTKVIDSVTVSPGVLGCASTPYTVSIEWPNRNPGIHPYWVYVDSDDVVVEGPPGNQDNIAKGQVVVQRFGIQLPMIQR